MSEVVDSKVEPELNNREQTPLPQSDEPLPEPHCPASPESTDSGAENKEDGSPEAGTRTDGNDQTELVPEVGEDDQVEPSGEAGDEAQLDSAGESGPAPEVTTEQVVEAILFGADTPLTPAKIVSIVGTGSARDVRKYVENLNQRYEQTGASFRIEKIAGGYQMLTLPAFNAWLKRLKQTRQESKLSQAAMETLAVVAYKQPVVRAEIEAIRGVATGEMLNRLRELGLVKIVGRAEDVGRPLLYGTTKRFLDVFGLGSLEDLPTVEELKAPE